MDVYLSDSLKPTENERKRGVGLVLLGFTLASSCRSLNSENWGSFPLSVVLTINPKIRLPNYTKQTHFKPINTVFWLENRRNRVFLETCFSISHFCNSTQIPVFQTANPGHYQAPIRTGNLRSASQITAPNLGWSPSSLNLKSGHIPAPNSQILPILAPFRYRQAPVRSKTPGVFALTGYPTELLTIQ